jgi:N-acetylneuraminic acid mutarotase
MADKVKSGKEILDDFFNDIEEIENVDTDIAKMLSELYLNDKLTDTNVKNELQKLRDGNQD